MNIYKGILEAYYETGYEGCNLLILQDYRGMIKNPNHDPSKPDSYPNIPVFYSIEWAAVMSHGDYLIVYKKASESEIEWEGIISKDRLQMMKRNFRVSFIPKEVKYDTWLKWFIEKRKAEIRTKKKLDVDK